MHVLINKLVIFDLNTCPEIKSVIVISPKGRIYRLNHHRRWTGRHYCFSRSTPG